MDELTVMRSFRAERVKQNPAARAAAWRALEDRFESAPAAAAPPAIPARRRRLLPRRRRLLAFAGATATAAVVAGMILVFDSGPTAQSAAARILHETAAVAVSPDASPLPGHGQFYYRKFKRLELKSWIPGGESMGGGVMTRPGAFKALMPTTTEWWTASDGAGRVREVGGTPQFLTDEERAHWEAEGSRLPAPFDPEYQRKYSPAFRDALELRRGVVDREVSKLKGFRFPDTSKLPTDPEELRRAVENNQISVGGFNLMSPSAKRLDTGETIAQLFNFLMEGTPMRPQLRAAVFNALAELPGIKVDTEATDSLGRQGYAIRLADRRTGGGTEFIFDPDTAEMLAERAFLGDHGRSAWDRGLPAGLTVRETVYLESGVADSTRETAAEADAGGPVATTSPYDRSSRRHATTSFLWPER